MIPDWVDRCIAVVGRHSIRRDNHAVAIHKKHEVGFLKPFVLSFSVSRYPSDTYGKYIKKARLEKGLKQVDVARAIGVDEMTIVNWERYDTLPKRKDKILRLCDCLGLNLQELIQRFEWQESITPTRRPC